MNELHADDLRALIKLILPVQTLKLEIEKAIHLELYHGTAALTVRSYEGLHASVVRIMGDDSYLAALRIENAADATEKEIVSQVMLAAGQLLAYLTSQTGTDGLMQGSSFNLQTAPQIAINTSNNPDKHKERVMRFVEELVDEDE